MFPPPTIAGTSRRWRLTDEQMKEIVTAMLPQIKQWDDHAARTVAAELDRIYDKAVEENRAPRQS